MAKYISVRELRKNLASVVKDVKAHYERYVVSKRGKPEAVLMSMDDYEGWLETLEIMSDPEVMKDIKEAEKEFEEGKAMDFEKIYGKKIKKTNKRHKK
ncbi:MAG: type II toxin-antitoxin system Phd/YefM family antitoxin [Candidatus Omnitrophica bacterium]|nr:type II toxin-antitoxin system Phd/YefM family antitoxin [Candidatus Omnitrophota bacterium]